MEPAYFRVGKGRIESVTMEEAVQENNILRSALRAIIERADNGTLGSSKVQDMRKLAKEALGE